MRKADRQRERERVAQSGEREREDSEQDSRSKQGVSGGYKRRVRRWGRERELARVKSARGCSGERAARAVRL